MTVKEIATRLVTYCRQTDWQGAYETLYSPDARSIEPFPSSDKIKEKAQRFNSMIAQVLDIEVLDPLIAGQTIALLLQMDAEIHGHGITTVLSEICVYTVKDGKIIQEQFFYNTR